MSVLDVVVPDFVVVGASKAGTTSIYSWLARHPDVAVPYVKDTYFFNHDITPETAAAYGELFVSGKPGARTGDVTPSYLDDLDAPRRIHAYAPDAKVIVSLREPASRIYSWAQMNVRLGKASDLLDETVRLAREPRFQVAPRIRALLASVPRQQVLALRFDDLAADPAATARQLFEFIGVDTSIVDVRAEPVHNPGGLPRSPLVHRLLEWQPARRLRRYAPRWAFDALDVARRANLRPADELDEAHARRLRAAFLEDIRETEDLLDLDLSGWLDDDLSAISPRRRKFRLPAELQTPRVPSSR
ncbi:MAG: sulfotransferase [Actinobacteria bacterium]|nr:sulfotransferase [Actinomycetota bacterium]MBV8959294.1 sulfotransferase [Actinomycetota bacterium]